jgi:hypothetical protein
MAWRAKTFLFAAVLALCAVVLTHAKAPCRWALLPEYADLARLASDEALQRKAVADIVSSELEFLKVATNAASALTYDGRPLDYTTGEVIPGDLHNFSAASKEAIHINVLTQAILDDLATDQIIAWPSAQEAVEVLRRKIETYRQFDREYPGFGGFLPWFTVGDEGMAPTWDFKTRVPSLDNGELIWSMIAAAEALR